jgi:hypothetical protein
VEHDSARLRQRGQPIDGLDGSDLVVHPHHRCNGDIGRRQPIERCFVDDAVWRHQANPFIGAFDRGLVRRTEDGLVLDRSGENGIATLAPSPRAPDAEDGEVVAFGTAGRDDDLVRTGAKTSGDSLAGLIECGPRVAAPAMDAGGISEPSIPERRHGLEDLGADRRRGSMIEVDRIGHELEYKALPGLALAPWLRFQQIIQGEVTGS